MRGTRKRLGTRLGQPLPPFTFAESDAPAGTWVVAGAGILLLYGIGVPTVLWVDAFADAHGFAKAWWFAALGCLLVPTSCIAGIGLAVKMAFYLFRNHFPLRFGAGCATVGELARFLAECSQTTGADALPWTEESIWLALRAILAEASGRRAFEIMREMQLEDALG